QCSETISLNGARMFLGNYPKSSCSWISSTRSISLLRIEMPCWSVFARMPLNWTLGNSPAPFLVTPITPASDGGKVSGMANGLIARALLKTAVSNPGQLRDPCPHLRQETAKPDSHSAATAGPCGDRGDRLRHRTSAANRRVQQR